jgi:hypothetical protein
MKSKTYRELRERAYEYLTLNRFPNTNGHKEAKRFLKNLLREKSIPFWEEPFSVKSVSLLVPAWRWRERRSKPFLLWVA